jgi:hypothetical protein
MSLNQPPKLAITLYQPPPLTQDLVKCDHCEFKGKPHEEIYFQDAGKIKTCFNCIECGAAESPRHPSAAKGECWEGKVCELDEFGHCVVCCDCKECIKLLREVEDLEENE